MSRSRSRASKTYRNYLVGWVVLLNWAGLQKNKSDKNIWRGEEITSTDKSKNKGIDQKETH